MKDDYIWTDGEREYEFKGDKAFERAVAVREIARLRGKIWRRTYDSLGYLEGVTDVTPESKKV